MPAPKSRAKRKNVPTSIRGGTIKVETAVREMTITVAGPIKPADTAVWPITRAPTMLTACPKERGILILASLKISKMIITSSASSTAGKGVPSLAEVMEIKRGVGISSWLKLLNATKNAGDKILSAKLMYLIHLIKVQIGVDIVILSILEAFNK